VLQGYGYLLYCHGRYSLREAVAQYERAIKLDPGADKPRYQWIVAKAALREPEQAIALYQQRLAQAPTDLREHRLLANAYLAAHQYGEAGRVVDAGLALAPDDRTLLEVRGQVRRRDQRSRGCAGRLAPRGRPRHIGPVYSSAFLLERLGRLQEAVTAWEFIVEWCQSRGATVTRRPLTTRSYRRAQSKSPQPGQRSPTSMNLP
jgi:tetratricopeptide (TPR) repeat protein